MMGKLSWQWEGLLRLPNPVNSTFKNGICLIPHLQREICSTETNLSSGPLTTLGADLLHEISELTGSIKESFIFISSCITFFTCI